MKSRIAYAIASRPARARGLKLIASGHCEQLGDASRPARARGLKPFADVWIATTWSRPARARGLKRLSESPPLSSASRPARARGLKLCVRLRQCATPWSRPARARGLKHQLAAMFAKLTRVAPRAGAWIETCSNWHGYDAL